jgi:dipeptidase E
MRRLLLYGGMRAQPEVLQSLIDHFKGCQQIALIPYACIGDYAAIQESFQALVPSLPFIGLHEHNDPRAVLAHADGIWVMGGNSFVLADRLHTLDLIEPVRRMVASGLPYAGASAGANVAGPTICTTNDMPILRHPRSLDGFGLVPFQINPHYLDDDAPAGSRIETRAARIQEFLALNDVMVVGLRENSWLALQGPVLRLCGEVSAVIFARGRQPQEVSPGSDLSWLLSVVPHFSVPLLPPDSLA